MERAVYCNRTLNLRSIQAVGYDMDYTLVHYHVEAWERRAYEYLKASLLTEKWPVENLEFQPDLVCRGLVVDTLLGNIVKANRFGFIKKAMHGTRFLDHETQRKAYSRTIVDLSENRWVFLNSFFSLSEGCMYAQLVELLDQSKIPAVMGYGDLYRKVRHVLDTAHMEGRLKAEIIADPKRFVFNDPETALALLDQQKAGKRLMLITNSEWPFTVAMMSHVFDPLLPQGMKWRDLFDLVIVGARKPQFFTTQSPFFEVVTEEGLLRPGTGTLKRGMAYLGGSAAAVEKYLGLSGDEILYVGDHMFGDVRVTKNVLRWRTALILNELEEELRAVREFAPSQEKLNRLMADKEKIEAQLSQLRISLQRKHLGYGPASPTSQPDLQVELDRLRARILELDQSISPLAQASSMLNNPHWGLLMRAGNDKSQIAYQMERYADIYTSRVSNFLHATPFAYLRSTSGTLPHDLAKD